MKKLIAFVLCMTFVLGGCAKTADTNDSDATESNMSVTGDESAYAEDGSTPDNSVDSDLEDIDLGDAGDKITKLNGWALVDGTLIVSGSGPMRDFPEDFEESSNFWTLVDGTIAYVEKSKVESELIGGSEAVQQYFEKADYLGDFNKIKNIVIKNGVTSIGNNAFNFYFEGSDVVAVSIPSSVTSIGDYAFASCEKLKSITIPNSVTSIGKGAFGGTGIKSITIPDSVSKIGEGAFPLEASVSVSSGNKHYTVVDGVLFTKDMKTLVRYPSNKTNNSYAIPDGVTSIANNAFENCGRLTNITIPGSLKNIGDDAFWCGSLTSITLPDSVESIGLRAFSGCKNLTSLNISESNANYTVVDGVLFTKDMKTLVCDMYSSGDSYAVPDGVITIGDHAFDGGNALASISIPNSVKYIGDYAFYGRIFSVLDIPGSVISIGNSAFEYCSCLTSVTIGNGVEHIGDNAFADCEGLKTVNFGTGVKTIGNSAFENCRSITSITLPDSLTSIGANAFYNCQALTSANFGNGVKTIGNSAFAGGNALTSISIPNSVESIGDDAFSGGATVSSIKLGSGLKTIGNEAFYGFDKVKSLTLPNGLVSIGDCAFADCNFGSVTIPASVTSLGVAPFRGQTNINVAADNANYTSVKGVLFTKDMKTLVQYPSFKTNTAYTIPKGVENIGDEAFFACWLKSITLPNSVKTIGARAFIFCDDLKSITIPDSVVSIGDYAFEACYGLKSLTLPNSVKTIGADAFSCCNDLKSIHIPDSVESMDGAFLSSSFTSITVSEDNKYYTAVDNVLFTKDMKTLIKFFYDYEKEADISYVIPDGVETIGFQAFRYCKLKSVTIPDSVKHIGVSAFYDCKSLENITLPAGIKSVWKSAFYGCSSLKNVVNYAGTVAQWDKVATDYQANIVTVVCSDGKVSW